MAKGKSFRVDTSVISKLGDAFGKSVADIDKDMEKKVTTATRMVWQIAHARRPYISKAQMKAEGRSVRVSDPGAQAGVPVRTGRLQASILQKVSRTAYAKFEGVISTHGVPYAGAMEYGTRKVQARPFMRPAVNLTKDAIKKLFGLQVVHTQ